MYGDTMIFVPFKTFSLQQLMILKALDLEREAHGLAISETTGIKTGSLYPALKTLLSKGYVSKRDEEGSEKELGRGLRTYYSITKDGADALSEYVKFFAYGIR